MNKPGLVGLFQPHFALEIDHYFSLILHWTRLSLYFFRGNWYSLWYVAGLAGVKTLADCGLKVRIKGGV